jgi:hypothetical protein
LAGDSDSGGLDAGTIVPLYTFPTHRSWHDLVAARAAHPDVPVVAIINPASGPGTAKIPAYVSGIPRLKAGGVTVIGYVATGYGDRPADAVEAAIDRYHAWYPDLDGIFLDEMSDDASDAPYYAALTGHVKALGMTLVVGNPGTEVPPGLVEAVDVVLVYEDGGLPPLETLEPWQACRAGAGIIPYGVPSLDAGWVGQAKRHVRWIYVTDQGLPNPWDALPGYFVALLGALAGPAGSIG